MAIVNQIVSFFHFAISPVLNSKVSYGMSDD